MKFFRNWQNSKKLRKLVRENAEQGKSLCIMEDLVFKAMLASETEDSREALRSLLSACIRREVSSVRLANSELIPAYLGAKSPRLDVHVIFNNGEAADLEMQMCASGDDIKSRAEVYNALMLAGQVRRGHSYGSVKRVYQIFFLNCILFPNSSKLPRRYSSREETEHDRLTDISEIILYEMPKMEGRVKESLASLASKGKNSLSEDEKWCIFMKYRHEDWAKALINKLSSEEAGIMHAQTAVNGISRDYLRYARKMAELKNDFDRGQEINRARREALSQGLSQGISQGLSQGVSQASAEIARKMKAAGRPLSEIEQFTGLAPQEIEQL